jgi:putative FmdB family regulatory protein
VPTYEFTCRDCGSGTEVRASISDKRAGLSPRCGACAGTDLRQVLPRVALRGRPPVAAAAGCCGAGGCGCGAG